MADKKILVDLNVNGKVEANQFVRDNGLISEYLMADGSVSNGYSLDYIGSDIKNKPKSPDIDITSNHFC